MKAHITLLPGDGIGPEVVAAGRAVLEAIARKAGHQFSFEEHLIGGCAIDAEGTPLSDATLRACQASQAVLLGAVGGPKWDDPNASVRPEQGLLALRKGLAAFANLRPVKAYPALVATSPLKAEKLAGVDLLVVRELTGGLYFGQPKGRMMVNGRRRGVDTMEYFDDEIRRVVKVAFELARGRRKKLTSVDKANVLDSSRLWRQVANEVAVEYPDVQLEHMLVDTAAMRLVTWPAGFDVIVTENTFGDILTDEAAVLGGSMGVLPSASLGSGGPGLYEPIHGSAPALTPEGLAAEKVMSISSVPLAKDRAIYPIPSDPKPLEARMPAIVEAVKTLMAGMPNIPALQSEQYFLTSFEESVQGPATAPSKWLDEITYSPKLYIHPQRAGRLGIHSGDSVILTNSNGASVEGTALLFEGIHPDALAIPMHHGHTGYGRVAQGEPFSDPSDPDMSRLFWAKNRGVNPADIYGSIVAIRKKRG